MSGLGLTWFDAVVLVVVLLSAARAYHNGFVKDIFGVIAFVAAIVVAIIFTPGVSRVIQKTVNLDGNWVSIAVAIALLAFVYVAIKSVAGRLVRSIDSNLAANAIDNAIGGLYGIARGVLLMALLVFALKTFAGDPDKSRHTLIPEAVTESASFPVLDWIATALAKALPKADLGGQFV